MAHSHHGAHSNVVQDGTLIGDSSPSPDSMDIASESSSLCCWEDSVDGDVSAHLIVVELQPSTLITPKSQHLGWTPPLGLQLVSERAALNSLQEAAHEERALAQDDSEDHDYEEFDLDQFCFYISPHGESSEMRSLHDFYTKCRHSDFYFDGIVSKGTRRHFVQNIKVSALPIGNYGKEFPSVRNHIWVESPLSSRTMKPIYYRLRNPSLEYARFHKAFIWVADLTKHVIDFCEHYTAGNRRTVLLSCFEKDFGAWLRCVHGSQPCVRSWHDAHRVGTRPAHDFCSAVVAASKFIRKEVYGQPGGEKMARRLHFLREVDLMAYKKEPLRFLEHVSEKDRHGKDQIHPVTVVTPYIKKCFGHMIIGKLFRLAGRDAKEEEATRLSLSPLEKLAPKITMPRQPVGSVQVGDVISTSRDGDETGTKWRKELPADDGRWFALVQKVHESPRGKRTYDVIWLYRPSDTPCCMMRYPWANELFLSDHCSCEEGEGARITHGDILATHIVNWGGSPQNCPEQFCIRQTYQIEKRRWVTLDMAHRKCSHQEEAPSWAARPQWIRGDTLLVKLKPEFTEPCEVIEVSETRVVKSGRRSVQGFLLVRQLLRRRYVDKSSAPPNELVYSELESVVSEIKSNQVIGTCVVRCFCAQEAIPTPYDRGGTGGLFFVRHRLRPDKNGRRLVTFRSAREFPPSLRQGFDPSRQMGGKLKGLDLFCGSGNFGRGLEEGGAVGMRWAVDLWENAIHTYMANVPAGAKTEPFLGSVDDLLHAAIEGKFSKNVPRPGEVDFIAAGSPCPGFSNITQDKEALKQIKNQSLVASFASFVDLYRPKFGILENVTGIVQTPKNRTQDTLSQLFCALVGLGYQAQLVIGDSWAHGAPQRRTRIFLYFAAAGHRLPNAPVPSHSHPADVNNRGLGILCNGEEYVQRSFDPVPFKFVSAGEATADLAAARIFDGKPNFCVPYPDHRVTGMTPLLRHQIRSIPMQPYGMGFAMAYFKELRRRNWRSTKNPHSSMSESDRKLFPEDSHRTCERSRGWVRQDPRCLFATVTTKCMPTDARGGPGLHWSENRCLSVMEMRRAQGFPDKEVLIGGPREQWKLVGNSVVRPVALALGLKFREALVGSLYEDERPATRGRTSALGSVELRLPRSVPVRLASTLGVKPSSSSKDISRGATTETDGTPAKSLTPARSLWGSTRSAVETTATTPDDAKTDKGGAGRKRPRAETMRLEGLRTSKRPDLQHAQRPLAGHTRPPASSSLRRPPASSALRGSRSTSLGRRHDPRSSGRSLRHRASAPVYNLAQLIGTDRHGKRRAKGDDVVDTSRAERRRPIIAGAGPRSGSARTSVVLSATVQIHVDLTMLDDDEDEDKRATGAEDKDEDEDYVAPEGGDSDGEDEDDDDEPEGADSDGKDYDDDYDDDDDAMNAEATEDDNIQSLLGQADLRAGRPKPAGARPPSGAQGGEDRQSRYAPNVSRAVWPAPRPRQPPSAAKGKRDPHRQSRHAPNVSRAVWPERPLSRRQPPAASNHVGS